MTGLCKIIALGSLTLGLSIPSAFAQDVPEQAPCSEGDRDIEIVTRTPPLWPISASLLCVEGYVRVEFTVGTSGLTGDFRVTEASAPGVFDQSAIDAVADWQFLPRCKDGQLVARQASQTIRFELPPDQADSCPEAIPEELLDLTIAIAAIYSHFADALLESGGEKVEMIDLQPGLDGDFARVEQLHIDAVKDQARVLNSEHQRALLQLSRQLGNFARLAADDDFSETRRLAAAHAEALERAFELDQRLQRELLAAARTVREDVELSGEDWEFLVGRFMRSERSDDQTLEGAKRYLDERMTLLRLLHERRDGWQPDPDNPYAQIYSDPELERLANEMKLAINQTIEEATTPQMEWLLSWSLL